MQNKIIRTVCLFTSSLTHEDISRINTLAAQLEKKDFTIQTKRICVGNKNIENLISFDDSSLFLSLGTLTYNEILPLLSDFYSSNNISFNMDLTNSVIEESHVQVLFDIIKNNARKTFNFTYVFNNAHSSPFFPSATYHSNGFSLGLQPTDLSEGCNSVREWLERLKSVWNEIYDLCSNDPSFIGIDSSIAPLFQGQSSFINFIKRLGLSFPNSTTTDTYVKITKYIKEENPKVAGLCGLMFPCLEDFELADEYEKGEFSLERNIYLSLHSGLGIDTYPMGVDENPQRVLEILQLIQALSNKYKKPLSTRFVSDGHARIGDMSNFENQYLKDITIRSL